MHDTFLCRALSQKLDNKMPFSQTDHGTFVTDEIFGLCVSVPEKLNPAYMYGMVLVASPAWVLGTYFGVLFETYFQQAS